MRNWHAEKIGREISKCSKFRPRKVKPSKSFPEKVFMGALDRISDVFVAFDAHMNFTYANARAGELLGRRPGALTGKNCWVEYPEAVGTYFSKVCRSTLETQTTVIIEDYISAWKGWFEYRVYPSPDGLSIFFTEISERKRLEEQALEKERFLSEAQRNARLGNWEFNFVTDTLRVSEELYRILGIFLKVFIKDWQCFLDLVHPDDRLWVKQDIEDYLAGKNPGERDFRVILADQTMRYLRGRGEIIFDAAGKPLRIFGTAQDITESKQAELLLKESEEMFSMAFHQNPAAMAILSLPERRFVDVNDSFLRKLERSRDEVIGNTTCELDFYDNPEDREHVIQAFSEQGSIKNFDLTVKTKTGRLRTGLVAIESYNLMGKDYLLIMAIDVTECVQAQQALRENEQRLRSVLENSPDVIFSLDIPSRQVTFYNRKEFHGYNEQDLNSPGSILKAVHPDDLPDVSDYLDQTKIKQSFSPIEYRLRGKNGGWIWIQQRTTILAHNPDGTPQKLLVTVSDITERRQAEEEIKKHLAELEAINHISTVLRQAQTLNEMLPFLLDETLKTVGTDTGGIWLYNVKSAGLYRAICRGWFTQLEEENLLSSEGIAGQVFQSGDAHVSFEFNKDVLTRKDSIPNIPAGWGGACVPIRAENEIIGVLFASVQLPRRLGAEDVRLLVTVSEIVGSAIRRSELHEQIEQQLQRLVTLHDIDQAISSTLELGLLLETLLKHIVTQLGVDAADILKFDPQSQILEYLAGYGFRLLPAQKLSERIGEGHAGRAALKRQVIRTIESTLPSDPAPTDIHQIPEEGFIDHISVPLIAKGEVKGVLEILHRSPLAPNAEWFDILKTLAEHVAIAMDNASLFEDLRLSNRDLALAYNATIEGWSRAMDMRDKETENHTRRVTDITMRLAQSMEIGEDQMVHIWRGALLHDIGKLGVPDSILLKPGGLTEEEWVVMRRHPQLAYDLLYPIEYLRPALDIPYCHHEKWDGSGYPRGLKGEEIPLAARIFALADVFDALTSGRPYTKAWKLPEVVNYFLEQSGKHFDPLIVDTFLSLLQNGELSKDI